MRARRQVFSLSRPGLPLTHKRPGAELQTAKLLRDEAVSKMGGRVARRAAARWRENRGRRRKEKRRRPTYRARPGSSAASALSPSSTPVSSCLRLHRGFGREAGRACPRIGSRRQTPRDTLRYRGGTPGSCHRRRRARRPTPSASSRRRRRPPRGPSSWRAPRAPGPAWSRRTPRWQSLRGGCAA